MAAHLLNTFALLAALGPVRPARAAPTWWCAWPLPRARASFAGAVGGGLVAMIWWLSGAVVALGDTLFPARSWRTGPQDFAAGAHLFVRLRVFHPVLAVASAIYFLVVVASSRGAIPARPCAGWPG